MPPPHCHSFTPKKGRGNQTVSNKCLQVVPDVPNLNFLGLFHWFDARAILILTFVHFDIRFLFLLYRFLLRRLPAGAWHGPQTEKSGVELVADKTQRWMHFFTVCFGGTRHTWCFFYQLTESFFSNPTQPFFLCVCKQSCLGLPDSGVPASISSWPGSHWECCRCRWSWTLWRLPTWCQPQDIAWAQWCCGRQLPHLTPIFWNNTQEIDGQQFYSEQPLLT